MSISKKKGDNGTAGVIGGERLAKDHPLMECLGTIDELNSFLGDAKAALPDKKKSGQNLHQIIEGIQKELFIISGIIVGSMAKAPGIESLTALIQEIKSKLPPLTGFTVSGTNSVSAKLHIARTVCRRAERRLVSMGCYKTIPAKEFSCLLAWFNRLSDLLFLMALGEDQGL